jgi:hypothetical protein
MPAAGKEPVGRWKRFQTCRPDERALRRLFSREGVTGLAVILGPVSGGLVCRDFDFEDSYDRWAVTHRDLAAALPTVESKRGYHVYFRGPEAYLELEDGEYRGDSGHYSVLPPSRHPDGPTYRWRVPLPRGPLPEIDPEAVGLLPARLLRPCHTESAENTENPGGQAAPHQPPAPSALSVWHQPDPVERAILETLPAGPGRRHWALFELARRLKAIPHLAGADAAELKPLVRRWHQQALRFIRTKPFEESWLDFADTWDRVRFPAGVGPLETLWAQALAGPLPESALDYDQDGVRRLVALCEQLQRHAGRGTFFLACRTAGQLAGVNHKTAWRWLRLLEIDKVLRRVSTGSKATHRANEYVYTASAVGGKEP